MSKILHFGGSIKDKEQKKLIKGFEVLFKLIPIAPDRFLKLLVRKHFYRYFSFLPFFMLLFIDVFAGLKYKRHHPSSYIKYYLKHIFSLRARKG